MMSKGSSFHGDKDRGNESVEVKRVAYSVNGSPIEILLSLPVIEANAEEPVDLWIPPWATCLRELLEAQGYVERVYASPPEKRWFYWGGSIDPSVFEEAIPVYGHYREVIPLFGRKGAKGYRPDWLAWVNGLNVPSSDYRLYVPEEWREPMARIMVNLSKEAYQVFYWVCMSRRLFRNSDVLWLKPFRNWSVGEVRKLSGRLLDAEVFVGEPSFGSILAMLMGLPTILLVDEKRSERLQVLIPSENSSVQVVVWRKGGRLESLQEALQRVPRS